MSCTWKMEEVFMAGDVIAIRAGQQPPEFWDAFIFIGGPAPAPASSAVSWQAEVITLLQDGWTGAGQLVVFVHDVVTEDLMNCHRHALEVADVVMLWWPDDTDPQLMSASLAAWNDSSRVVHGTPPSTSLSSHLAIYADAHAICTTTTLGELVNSALDRVGCGARRASGERDVPLTVWRSGSFQRWYSAQTAAGNTLLGARQVWTFSAGPRQTSLIYWALHVRMYVQAENRIKSNEVVISRPDISVMALYHRGATIDDTIIVLVREFRSPASSPDGLVHELPGGSAATGSNALDQAITETEEETGLAIDVQRIRSHGSRQLAATMSAHHAHLFAAEISDDELARLRASKMTPHGVGGTERTWPEITTFGELRERHLLDWATLGMITEALFATSSLPQR
jgi:ADP-ribose pyrophosphatase YjhB (NUDIX family)